MNLKEFFAWYKSPQLPQLQDKHDLLCVNIHENSQKKILIRPISGGTFETHSENLSYLQVYVSNYKYIGSKINKLTHTSHKSHILSIYRRLHAVQTTTGVAHAGSCVYTSRPCRGSTPLTTLSPPDFFFFFNGFLGAAGPRRERRDAGTTPRQKVGSVNLA